MKRNNCFQKNKILLYSLKKAFTNTVFKVILVISYQYEHFMDYVNHNKVKISNCHF